MSVSELLAQYRRGAPLVEPSLLACDFANVEREIRRVAKAGARSLHLDVMDGHFVPNISIGIPVVEAVRRVTDLALHVHLMISDPRRYIRPFREAGADLITIHIESVPEPGEVLEEIRSLGAGVGLTLNPPTAVSTVEPWLRWCDLVLVMSVMAGFGGQEFEPVALKKLARLRACGGPDLLLAVDGGVNRETIGACAAAGADVFIVGTALFTAEDYGGAMAQLRNLARANRKGTHSDHA